MGYSKNVWKCWLCSEWNSSALLDAYCIIYCWLHTIFIHNVKQCVICNDKHLKGYIEKTHTVHRIFAKMCTIQQSLLWGVLLPCSLLDMTFYLQCDEWAGSNISLFLDSSFSFILSAKVRASWIFFSSGIENEFNNCLYTWVTASSRLIQLVRYYSISLKHNFSGLQVLNLEIN